MNYREHPLLRVSGDRYFIEQPKLDMTPANAAPALQNGIEVFFDFLRKNAYPFKNSLERKKINNVLELTEGYKEVGLIPNVISKGHKGFSQSVFLNRIRSLIPEANTIICYGCGTGDEAITIAKILKPKKIIGLDYFNYTKYWNQVQDILQKKYSVESQFVQIDPSQHLPVDLKECCDMVYSHAVLEHIRDMDETFPFIKGLMKRNGFFVAQWGPMWYSYSGDHISGELGLGKGYEHLLLNSEEYMNYYRTHPRNREDVSKGNPTWLELGLHNFGLYSEYIESLAKHFGTIHFLQWVVAPEALSYKKIYKDKWKKVLSLNAGVTELDLLLQCAGIVIKNNNV